MADSKLSASFNAEFRATIQLQGKPPNEHFMALVDVLKQHSMCYVVDLHPRFFLTHVKNRGGLLLSPHNVHKNAAGIKNAGADLEQLNNAWATELPAAGRLRVETITKNSNLIQRADGLLAAINGSERFCSLGCGHTVAFCKHADAGGRTPEKSLQRGDSELIDLQKLCANRNFETMIKKGWKWNVVYACVDEAFPEFAQIAQRALNTRNHVNNVIGELEACMTLAQTMADPGMQDVADWKNLAVQNLVSLCAPCSHFGDVLLDYIIDFGGGENACVIQFVDNVAKQFAANVPMGETFWRALLGVEFADKQCKYPLLRTALMLANLTGKKTEDGTARSLGKSNISMVASKAKMAEAIEAEKTMEDAWKLASAISSVDAALKPLGQMFVRIGLKVCGLENKVGRENRVYSMVDIKKNFIKDLGVLIGKKIEYPKWFDADGASSPEPSESVVKHTTPKMATIEDHFDPTWICGQSGYKLGTNVVEKNVASTPERPGIFVIFSIGETVALHEACNYSEAPVRANISVEELLKNWTITKTEPPLMMQEPSIDVPEAFSQVLTRHQIFSQILEAHSKHQQHLADLSYFRRPDQVRTKNVNIKAGALTLVPWVPINNIVIDSNVATRFVSVGAFDGRKYSIIPLGKPAHTGDVWEKHACVNAFFWVQPTSDKKLANMAVTSLRVPKGVVPVMRNAVDIGPFTKLCVFAKPKAAAAPLQNALQDDDSDHDDDAADGDDATVPKAKAKAKAKAAKKAKAGASSRPAKKAKTA